MKISRRGFLKTASAAALSAGVLLQSGLPAAAQKFSKTGFPIPFESQTDALAFLSQSSFESCLNSYFYFQSGTHGANLRLTAIADTRTVGRSKNAAAVTGECFSLTFRGSLDEPLEQENYFVNHKTLGDFTLFITVVSRHRKSVVYEAVINRLQPQ